MALFWVVLQIFASVFTVVLTSAILFYLWTKRRYETYFQSKGIPCPKPTFPFGNYSEVFAEKQSMTDFLMNLYQKYKREKLAGSFLLFSPMLLVNDYEIANRMLTTDFSYFESHGPEINEKLDPLGVHLFNASGKKWKELRMKMTPAFTSGKMKQMFLIMDKVGDELQSAFKGLADEGREVEVLDMVARFTTDVIGNCAFGVECNSIKDKDAPFRKYGQRIFNHSGLEAVKVAMGFFFPTLCNLIGMSMQKPDVQEFIFRTIRETVEYREKNGIKRNDFMDILLQIKNGTLVDDGGNRVTSEQGTYLTDNEFMSQVYLFFVAGFETSSSTTSFALYELACNPQVQEKARENVRRVLEKHGGQYTYEAINEMEYLGNVVNEALRKYPPVGMLPRKCTADYKVPGTNISIEKDTVVFIAVQGMQNDPEYFPDPEKFDPERFTSENRHPALNKLHMPFGYGPRICIGQRFGLMQSKVALSKLLDKYKFSVCDKTPVPMVMKTGFNMISPRNGNWLKVERADIA